MDDVFEYDDSRFPNMHRELRESRKLDRAMDEGDVDEVRKLVEEDPTLLETPHAGFLPIHTAAFQENDPAMIEVLLSLGSDVNARDELGKTPLHIASQQGNVENAVALISNGASIDALDDERFSPLLTACSFADDRTEQMVDLLIRHGAIMDLQCAIVLRNTRQIREFMAIGPEVIRQCPRREYLFHDLATAVKLHCSEVDPEDKDAHATAAVLAEYRPVFEWLKESGCDINEPQAPPPILCGALGSSATDIRLVMLLIELGADVNVACECFGTYGNAVSLARCLGREDIARLLVEHGAEDRPGEAHDFFRHFPEC
jgi:hypothetical protein